MSVTALITCAGSMPGVAVINALKGQQEIPIRIVGVDMSPLSAGFHLSDAHYLVPSASDASFIPKLLKICQQEKVNVLFPIIDEELLVLAQAREQFRSVGITVMTNDDSVVRIARDKYLTYQFCQEHGILAPITLLPSELGNGRLPKFPLIVKPRDGRGTVGVFQARNQKELDFFVGYVPNAIVQQCIEGPEYTIDVLTSFDGEILSLVPKERLQTKGGMQVKGRTIKDPKLLSYAETITKKFGLAPRANIQCIRTGEQIFLIEINPKFPASLPFTVAAGVNAPLLLIKMTLGQPVAPMVGEFENGLVMLRYWQEVYARSEPKS